MTAIHHLIAYHLWYILAILCILAILALILRKHVTYAMRLAKAAATDKRLPRPVRGLFGAALAVKVLPVDFGIDEALLLAGIVLLATKYRTTWREIRTELRTPQPERQLS